MQFHEPPERNRPEHRQYQTSDLLADQIADLSDQFAQMRLGLIKNDENWKKGLLNVNLRVDDIMKKERSNRAFAYNQTRDKLGLSGAGALNLVQYSTLPDTHEDSASDDDGYHMVSAVQYKKDGSPRMCYGCTASDHNAYECDKLGRLVSQGLFFAPKFEGTSMFLGTKEDAQEGLCDCLDPTSIRLYRDQAGFGLEKYICGYLEFLL